MAQRVTNFNAGPSTLPLAALERAQRELLDFEGSGMSIMEHSHRGPEYDAVHNEAIALIRDLLAVPDNYDILLMQGGASAQFSYIPMNLLPVDKSADYVITGTWAKKAFSEAKFVGKVRSACDVGVDGAYTRVPKQNELDLDPNAAYVHICSNNTITGTQTHSFPDTGRTPLVADMSSDILSRPLDVSKFGLIYAGAQKNIGPSGVAVVIVRKDLVEAGRTDIPKTFRYSEVAANNSLHNTSPTFAIYMMRNVLAHVKDQGGLAAVEKHNQAKAALLYDALDASADYYRCPVQADSRSLMNVVFRLPSEALEKKFVTESKQAGMVGLKGHRSVGGIRASIYNAMPLAGVEKLVGFMADFKAANPA